MTDDDYRDGKRAATLDDVRDEVKSMHKKLDQVIIDHGNRLTAIETTGKVFKYIISALGITTIVAFFKSMGGS